MNYLETDLDGPDISGKLKARQNIYRVDKQTNATKWLWLFLGLLVLTMVLPWTQNIRAKGSVTTLRQEERPQEVNTIIGGKALKWYVKEGDFVQAGDTILQLGEVKVDYLDPKLLERTQAQIVAKNQSIQGYQNKASTAQIQVRALQEARRLKMSSIDNKISQQQLKIKIDEADLVAIDNELSAYQRQIDAAQIMLDNGAISLIEFEKRKVNYQNGIAKKNSISNKLMQSRQELLNLAIEKNGAVQDYNDKIAKADGERFASLSTAASTDADVAKLQNMYSNYDARNKLYFITAPQSGQITKAKKAGIGEVLKEGEMLVEIVPDKIEYAVELFIDPMDLPLVAIGQKVRFIFDGFPAIVFSGWPQGSYGTFGGVVAAVETSVSDNGKFRILVQEDPNDKKWPKQLRMGGGANGIALLKDVLVGYELWRNINGFPPEYYKVKPKEKAKY